MNKNLVDFVLKYGLIVGLLQVIIVLFSYLMGIEYMVSYWLAFFNIIIVVGAVIYCGVLWKRMNKGYLDFKYSFLTIFLVYAIASLIVVVFNIALYNVDPDLPDQIKEAAVEKVVTMMEKVGAPEESIDEAIDGIENSDSYSISSFMTGYIWSLLWGVIIALIGGAVIKKSRQ